MSNFTLILKCPEKSTLIEFNISKFPDGQQDVTIKPKRKPMHFSRWRMSKVIYEDGKFFNQTTLNEIRERIRSLSNKFLEKEVIS